MLYDKDIREPLFDFLDETFGKNRIIEEKRMGKSRADVVMITEDSLYGIEIKSDADTYARLERQVKDYNRIWDYNIACVGTSHATHIKEHIPEYWGIITVEETEAGADFYLYRQPQPNPKREKKVKFRNQISLLWRMELSHLLEINNMHKYEYKSKAWVVQKLIDTVDEDTLKRQLCEELFERDYNTVGERIKEYREAKAAKTGAAVRKTGSRKKPRTSRRTDAAKSIL